MDKTNAQPVKAGDLHRRHTTVPEDDLEEVLIADACGYPKTHADVTVHRTKVPYPEDCPYSAEVQWDSADGTHEVRFGGVELKDLIQRIEPPKDGEQLTGIEFDDGTAVVTYEQKRGRLGGDGNENLSLTYFHWWAITILPSMIITALLPGGSGQRIVGVGFLVTFGWMLIWSTDG